MKKRPHILLTNDDGINSPGLWAAAGALARLGYVTVAAPREQVSGMGRSFPRTSDGRIEKQVLNINEQEWPVFAVGGTPAQAVQHAILEILPDLPDLVVSGINYGENLGVGITISGTVGAAMEGASLGIPSLAVSLQLLINDYLSYTDQDFRTAAHFTHLFAQMLLEKKMPPDVDLFKLEVPVHATPETPWRMTKLARHPYYVPFGKREGTWEEPYTIEAAPKVEPHEVEPDSDVYTVLFDKMVSVTPLSLDFTSRIDLQAFEKGLRSGE